MVKYIFLILVCAATFACTQTKTSQTQPEAETQSKSVFRHVVLFDWVDDITPEKRSELILHFKSLKNKIDVIRDFEYGEDASVEGLDKGYNHCFIVTFESSEGRDIYLPHPEHKVFGDSVVPYLKNVLVVDYQSEN